MESILSHTPAELREAFAGQGLPKFRASQVVRWIYHRRVREFARMSDLGAELRDVLAARWSTRTLSLDAVHESSDGTRKLVLRCEDGARIESVLIPEGERRTLCVSSQVGCSLACPFCATGLLGLDRNLRADEIVDQLLHASSLLAERDERVTHVVFMGMGEPLLNLDNVCRAIRIMTDPDAVALSRRRITVSTAGLVPRMDELGRALSVRLAVSLHATTDEVRDELVPLNRRFPIAELIEACRRYPLPKRDRISFEYTLIRDLNDSQDDALRLVALLRGLRYKINVIPVNEHPGSRYRRPDEDRVEAFVEVLARERVTVMVRRSRGDDILAACGQLGAAAPTQDPTVSNGPVR